MATHKKKHIALKEADIQGIVKSIGRRLREERERINMTQEEFAASGGIRRATQYLYEQGKRIPSMEYLTRVVVAGADLGYLVLGASTDNPSSNTWPAPSIPWEWYETYLREIERNALMADANICLLPLKDAKDLRNMLRRVIQKQYELIPHIGRSDKIIHFNKDDSVSGDVRTWITATRRRIENGYSRNERRVGVPGYFHKNRTPRYDISFQSHVKRGLKRMHDILLSVAEHDWANKKIRGAR